MRYAITLDGEELLVDVERTADGRYTAAVVGPSGPESSHTFSVEEGWGERAFTLVCGQKSLELVLGRGEDGLDVYASGERFSAKIEPARARSAAPRAKPQTEIGAVVAPMPGKVVKVLVRPGEPVEPGAPLVVVEAMKMENELFAKAAGRVRNVLVAPGDAVERGAVLMTIDPW